MEEIEQKVRAKTNEAFEQSLGEEVENTENLEETEETK